MRGKSTGGHRIACVIRGETCRLRQRIFSIAPYFWYRAIALSVRLSPVPSGDSGLCVLHPRSVGMKRPPPPPAQRRLQLCLRFKARARFSTVGPELIDLAPEAAASGGNRASK